MNNPFKFLASYEKEDCDIYFGRDREIEALYAKVQKSRLTLLYGPLRIGKTSLVQCGLAKKFSAADCCPLYVHRNNHLMKSIRAAIDANSDVLIPSNRSLLETLSTFCQQKIKTVYLLFDQFEDLFSVGTQEEQDEFVQFLVEVLEREDLNVKVVLVLREEYLAWLDQFEGRIPTIFNSRMRLERMSKDTLLDVLENIAERGNITIKDKEQVLQQIIDNIADEKNHVELSNLQIYLNKIYKSLEGQGGEKIVDQALIAKIGQLEDVLSAFLDEQVEHISQEVKDKDMVWSILKLMITTEGTKRPITLEELKAKLF